MAGAIVAHRVACRWGRSHPSGGCRGGPGAAQRGGPPARPEAKKKHPRSATMPATRATRTRGEGGVGGRMGVGRRSARRGVRSGRASAGSVAGPGGPAPRRARPAGAGRLALAGRLAASGSWTPVAMACLAASGAPRQRRRPGRPDRRPLGRSARRTRPAQAPEVGRGRLEVGLRLAELLPDGLGGLGFGAPSHDDPFFAFWPRLPGTAGRCPAPMLPGSGPFAKGRLTRTSIC